jgi:hypothetical protein
MHPMFRAALDMRYEQYPPTEAASLIDPSLLLIAMNNLAFLPIERRGDMDCAGIDNSEKERNNGVMLVLTCIECCHGISLEGI